MRFYQKGMSFKEFQRMMSEQPRGKRTNDCGCDCDGCAAKGAGTHCLKDPCTRTRNRRSPSQIDADERNRAGRVRAPSRPKPTVKRTAPQPNPLADKMRSEWFVDAKRNDTEVQLAMPEGEGEAYRCAGHLVAHGWHAIPVVRSTFRDDPRFHPLPPPLTMKEVARHGKT